MRRYVPISPIENPEPASDRVISALRLAELHKMRMRMKVRTANAMIAKRNKTSDNNMALA